MSEFEMNVNSNSDSDDELPPTLTDLPTQLNEILPPISNIINDEDNRKVIPVTILTGFLGSGKSCLLNHILTADHGKKIAVIENEFSSGLGIESMIVQSGVDGSKSEGFFELNNGCICCTVKDDLLLALEQLVRHKHKFDYLIIETTGVANPGPVISSLWTDEDLESSLKIDGVVCIVDSINILTYLQTSDIANDVRMQICYSDRILLNKSDVVTSEQVIK
jgi:G3E family GTPase